MFPFFQQKLCRMNIHCAFWSSRFLFYVYICLCVLTEIERSKASSMDMNSSWGIDHILDLDLLPCVADITNMLVTAHAFTWLQTLLVMTVLALICYCTFLPMNYVRVSH